MKIWLLIVMPFLLAGCTQKLDSRLPVGCSGDFQSKREVDLTCIAGEALVQSIVFGKPQSLDLEEKASCRITLSSRQPKPIAPKVSVSLLDENLKVLGSCAVANFLREEVSAFERKPVEDLISFTKGSVPRYFVVHALGSEPIQKKLSK